MSDGRFDGMNTVEEIVEIRERLARIENNIDHLVKASDRTVREVKAIPKEHAPTQGNIVIPVAAVTVFVNLAIALIQKFI